MRGKTESVTELADTNKETAENNEQEKREAPKRKTMSSWFRSVINFLVHMTVEPYLFFYMFPSALSGAAAQRLYYEKICRSDLNYSEAICLLTRNAQGPGNILAETGQVISHFYTWVLPMEKTIQTVMVLFFVAWSDKTGNRKLLMLAPLVGEIISCLGWIMMTYFLSEMPIWTAALVLSIPSALTGGESLPLIGSFCYISEVTRLQNRALRMGFIFVLVRLSGPIGGALSGLLLEAVGYYVVFTIKMALYIIGFIFTYYKVHNVRNVKIEGTLLQKTVDFFHPRNIWVNISILFVTPWKQRKLLILIIFAHMTILGPNVADDTTVTLYTVQRFRMSPTENSLFSSYSALVGTAGLSLGVIIISKVLKLHDSFLGISAGVSQVLGSIMYGLAPTKYWFYAGSILDMFSNNGVTASRALASKVVEPDKVGKMFSMLGIVESLVLSMYVPMFSQLFAATLKTLPGAVFILNVGVTIPSFFLFLIIYIIDRRRQRDEVKNPELKEMHAHDNQMTTL